MSLRRTAIAVVFVVVAVVIQTTLFVRLRPLDAAPALVLLVVFAVARHLEPDAALLVGFAAGLLLDLLSESPLGLWALVCSSVAFLVVRIKHRFEEDYTLLGPAVFIVSLAALGMFTVLGTIFGERTLADAGVVRKLLLPSAYNTVLAVLVLPAATRALQATRRRARWEL